MYRLFLLCLLGVLGLSASHSYWVDKEQSLILFTTPDHSIVSEEDIKSIRELAQSMNIKLLIQNSINGLPEEVTTLPSIYFQNRKGRSKYYGRYKNISRLKNFIRTSKLAHQKEVPNIKENILVWKEGRADMTAPIKLTALTGEVPEGFDQEGFIKESEKAIVTGMNKFKQTPKHNSTKNTRSFYFNIYPHLDECNRLSLTTEIYSQYNCVTAVFTQTNTPIAKGKWDKRIEVFKQAAQIIEAEIFRQIQDSDIGDAFQPVSNDLRTISWEYLNMPKTKPVVTLEEQKNIPNEKLARKWQVEKRIDDDEPIIIFSFLPPVDNYAGEVKALSGTLELAENLSMNGAKGEFKVDVSDVTMGAKDFDYEVHNKMLKIGLFPDAYFKFTAEGTDQPIEWGQSQQLEVKGTFTMMSIDIPINVDTSLEPIVNESGDVKLQVSCSFQLPLFEKFNIKGPDGPKPAKDILQFYMQFNLVEAN